jgi:manganese/iron transport system substrate-binding protein
MGVLTSMPGFLKHIGWHLHVEQEHVEQGKGKPYLLGAVLPHPLKSLFLGLTLTLGGVGLGACEGLRSAQPTRSDDQLFVVTTSTFITDWTEQIGGDQITVVGLLEPGVDPHIYEPVPADTRAIEEADLILYNGYNLEPALIRLIHSAGVNATTLAVGEVVPPLTVEGNPQEPDPHVWGDVERAIAMVEAIRDTLIELDPRLQALVTERTEEYIAELESLHTWIGAQIATIPEDQRRLVTTHDAFQYYAEAYGLEVTGTLIGISTEEQPSAQTVRQLVESIRETNVPTIFAETTINPRLIATVAEEAGVNLAQQELYSDSIGEPGSGAESYVEMMRANTQTIVENLGGQSQPLEREP